MTYYPGWTGDASRIAVHLYYTDSLLRMEGEKEAKAIADAKEAAWKAEEEARQKAAAGEREKQRAIESQKRAKERAILKEKVATLDTSGL